MTELQKTGLIALIILSVLYGLYAPNLYSYTPIVNNTDLGQRFGTGERLPGVVYWANITPIDVYIITHTETSGQNIAFNFSINGVNVSAYSKNSAVQDEHHPLFIHVPLKANYSFFVSSGIHHYEWREYQWEWR